MCFPQKLYWGCTQKLSSALGTCFPQFSFDEDSHQEWISQLKPALPGSVAVCQEVGKKSSSSSRRLRAFVHRINLDWVLYCAPHLAGLFITMFKDRQLRLLANSGCLLLLRCPFSLQQLSWRSVDFSDSLLASWPGLLTSCWHVNPLPQMYTVFYFKNFPLTKLAVI